MNRIAKKKSDKQKAHFNKFLSLLRTAKSIHYHSFVIAVSKEGKKPVHHANVPFKFFDQNVLETKKKIEQKLR